MKTTCCAEDCDENPAWNKMLSARHESLRRHKTRSFEQLHRHRRWPWKCASKYRGWENKDPPTKLQKRSLEKWRQEPNHPRISVSPAANQKARPLDRVQARSSTCLLSWNLQPPAARWQICKPRIPDALIHRPGSNQHQHLQRCQDTFSSRLQRPFRHVLHYF